MSNVRAFLRGLYFGQSHGARFFRYGLLSLDLLAILTFFLASCQRHVCLPAEYFGSLPLLEGSIGLLLLLDIMTRLWISGSKLRFLARFDTLNDGICALTLVFADILNLGFLRVFRVLDMIRSVRTHGFVRYSYDASSKSDVVFSRSVRLLVFVIVVTEIVFTAQVSVNDEINSYTDALYFTLMTLSTTGFGDVTLAGAGGRWLTIIIMVLGVSLFLRLIHGLWSTPRLRDKCPKCGFDRHELEASYCNRCGASIKRQD